MDIKQIKEKLKELYLSGKSRKEAMKACNLTSNQIAGQSNQLNLHWSWPIENRVSGIEPLDKQVREPPASAKKPPPKVPAKPPEQPKKEALVPKTEPASADPEVPKPAEASTPPAPVEARALQPAPETTPAKARPVKPSPGFMSARERRERGLPDGHTEPQRGLSEEEVFLNEHYRKQFG